MDSLDSIKALIDPKTYKILKLFLDNKDELFNLNIISSKARVPIASTFRITNHLVSMRIIDVMLIGKMKIYRIASNDKTKELEDALDGKLKK